jgi:arginine exporter protein ArgO
VAERSAQVKEEPAQWAGDTEQNDLPPRLPVQFEKSRHEVVAATAESDAPSSMTIDFFAPVFVQGLVLSLGLIVAIGAQNAFVLRQGLRREHVGSVVLFCAVADAVLIALGVLGMAQALGERPHLARVLALAGAVFLAVYGWQALRRARKPSELHAAEGGMGLSRAGALAQAAAFTLLNPHVYLDTVLLVVVRTAQSLAVTMAKVPMHWLLSSIKCAKEAHQVNLAAANLQVVAEQRVLDACGAGNHLHKDVLGQVNVALASSAGLAL